MQTCQHQLLCRTNHSGEKQSAYFAVPLRLMVPHFFYALTFILHFPPVRDAHIVLLYCECGKLLCFVEAVGHLEEAQRIAWRRLWKTLKAQPIDYFLSI